MFLRSLKEVHLNTIADPLSAKTEKIAFTTSKTGVTSSMLFSHTRNRGCSPLSSLPPSSGTQCRGGGPVQQVDPCSRVKEVSNVSSTREIEASISRGMAVPTTRDLEDRSSRVIVLCSRDMTFSSSRDMVKLDNSRGRDSRNRVGEEGAPEMSLLPGVDMFITACREGSVC